LRPTTRERIEARDAGAALLHGIRIVEREIVEEVVAGEEADTRVRIEPRQLSYWASDDDRWTVAAGRRPIYVGASSRDVKLTGGIDVKK